MTGLQVIERSAFVAAPLGGMALAQLGADVPGSPLSFSAVSRTPPDPAPILGQHTVEILADDLKLSEAEIGRLHDAGIVASPTDS